jgi:glycerate kinase
VIGPKNRMKKILLVPDSYKGTLSSRQVCEVLAGACRQFFPHAQIIELPASDGGEGLLDALIGAGGGERITARVNDPLLRPIRAEFGILPDGTAVVEMAAASGLTLLMPGERDATRTSSFGTGELIRHALEHGCKRIILGLGGSATCDSGAGLGAALGIRYLDATGDLLLTGGDLERLHQIDTREMLPALGLISIEIACDVSNPLHGPLGAACIYAPQKGASPGQVKMLNRGLRHLAGMIQRQAKIDLQQLSGSGAAGGAAVPLLAFAGARLTPGIDLVLDRLGFDEHLAGCDLVITGEGRSDAQTTMGKLVSGVGRRAKAHRVPVIALSGALGVGYEAGYQQGIEAFFSTTREAGSLEHVLENARPNLEKAAGDLFRLLRMLDRIGK